MKLKNIYFWYIGISILLVSLIFIQVYWLRIHAEMRQHEENSRIEKVLDNMKPRLESIVNCIDGYSKTFIDTADRFFIIKHHYTGAKKFVNADTLQVFYDPAQMGLKPDSTVSEKTVGFSYPVFVEMKLSFHFPVQKSDRNLLYQSGMQMPKNARNLKELMVNQLALTSLINMKLVDSFLKEELRKQHILPEKFVFGFIDPRQKKLLFCSDQKKSSELIRSANNIELFTDNKFLNTYSFALYLPGQNEFFSFDKGLIVSIAIMVLLGAGFYLFGRLFIRQTRLSEMKNDFINNLTHEFNTPMANIGLAVETLSESAASENAKISRVIQIISTESFRLRDNIERILQVATMEKGNLQIRKEPVDLVALTKTVVTAYQLQCEELGGCICFEHPEKCVIEGDEVHLLNCICNLLDNAIKYRAQEPVITIKIINSGTKVNFQVTDNGIGMNHETLQHIFDKFYRAHAGNKHNTKGFGLGLNYVKGIIGLHGGKITVQSKPGEGTKFTIHFLESNDIR